MGIAELFMGTTILANSTRSIVENRPLRSKPLSGNFECNGDFATVGKSDSVEEFISLILALRRATPQQSDRL
jgi:hypothetical protein